MMKEYIEVEVAADEELRGQLVGVMSQLGFEGFWEEGNILRCYMGTERWTDNMLPELESVARTMASTSRSAVPELSVRRIADQNWNEQWEKTIKPIHVGERIVITPSWHHYKPAEGEIVLIIDPKMSFGTGYHETTRLILRLMEQRLVPGMSLLDVGAGTGVLAIAAIKLGAESAIALDNDEWSYRNAQENILANGVDNLVTVILGEISSVAGRRFDMIVANLQRNVIEEVLGEMAHRLSTAGILILSGLLHPDKEPIEQALGRSHLVPTGVISENEWIAVAASRPLAG